MQRALDRFDAALRIGTPPSAFKLLNPGVEADLVRHELALNGLPTSSELEALYAWHDGTDASSGALLGQMWIIPGFYLLSLQEAAFDYATLKQDPRWKPPWFPVLADGGGDFYFIDFSADTTPVIRRYRFEEAEHPIEYESLASMIDTMAAAFETRAIEVDETEYVNVNHEAFTALAADMNPNVPWWTDLL
jgi:cell wall assembly regulator SMI1